MTITSSRTDDGSSVTKIPLRLGRPVEGADGPLGVVTDIVVDPTTHRVTHVVVAPRHQHLQARLVPVSMIKATDSAGPLAAPDLDHHGLLQLPRFTLSEFVPFGGPIDVGTDWDVADERVVVLPYWGNSVVTGGAMFGDQVDVEVDRVPTGECEIRRSSIVFDPGHRPLGHVEGLVVDRTAHGDHVTGVVVRRGVLGLHHLVVVPISRVTSVRNDSIEVDLDRDELAALPPASADRSPSRDSIPSPLEAQLSLLAHRALSWVRSAPLLHRRNEPPSSTH